MTKNKNFFSRSILIWLLVLPTIVIFYIGLFLTMMFWYPVGLPFNDWQAHILNFTIVYILWFATFFSYRLFDWETLRVNESYMARLAVVLIICLSIAAMYFYFQPQLLITPRRFLIVHVLLSGILLVIWYSCIRVLAKRMRRVPVYLHNDLAFSNEIKVIIDQYDFLGLRFAGYIDGNLSQDFPYGSILVLPNKTVISSSQARLLFDLRSSGVKLVEYQDMYERLTRTIHLAALNEFWFIDSIEYGRNYIYDFAKKLSDILFGLLGLITFLITFPVIGLLIKFTSKGNIFFTQLRVGLNSKPFKLYKYRTMTEDSISNEWAGSGQKVTLVGKFLRATRFDELPQSINILKGDMSVVGPRPEQVNIVEQMRQQIPYYDERHIVKPGLTGWAQLHVYAATVEETQRKLQYDLYYIKHRSLMFDLEIILKTAYNILTLRGR